MYQLKKKVLLLSVAGALLVALSGCAGNGASAGGASGASSSQAGAEEASVTLGELNGNFYTNESLGITMEIPDGWYALDEEQRMEIVQAGSEILADGDETKQKMLDLSMQRTLPLLCAYEVNPVTTAESNPNIQLTAEKMSLLNSAFVKTADDYISAMKTQLESVKNVQGVEVAYTFGEIGDTTFGDKDFRILPTKFQLADGTLLAQQDYYIYFDKQYAIVGIATYFDEDQNEVLKASLQTLKIA